MIQPDIIKLEVPAFAIAVALKHGEHEWESVLHKTAHLMRDLGPRHLSDQDFISINHQVLLCPGDGDKMVSFEETERVAHLLQNDTVKILPDTAHAFEHTNTAALSETLRHLFS